MKDAADIIKEYQKYLRRPAFNYYVYIRPGVTPYFVEYKDAKKCADKYKKKVKRMQRRKENE